MLNIRDFQPSDSQRVDAIALQAFDQFKDAYDDWPAFQARIANASSLATTSELIIAEHQGAVVGAVAYVAPGIPKADYFQQHWPIMRMLVVDPAARGLGIGRALADECIRRAQRDGARQFALHTSELMQVALPMYLRMGFRRVADIPAIHGVAYAIYLKELDGPADE